MRDYQAALETHKAIAATCPSVGAAKVRFRKPDRPVLEIPEQIRKSALDLAVDRDKAICALAIKAATTKEAIAYLCDQGFGDDAFALSRVLLENAAVLAWLLHDDRILRIDTYCAFASVVRDRWRQIVHEYYGDSGAMQAAAASGDAEADASIAAEIFEDRYQSWAWFRQPNGKLRNVRLGEMMSSMSSSPAEKIFMYEGAYFDASGWVHSSPPSIADFARALGDAVTYRLAPVKNDHRLVVAMDLSNVAMLLVLSALDDFLNLQLGERLKEILQTIKA